MAYKITIEKTVPSIIRHHATKRRTLEIKGYAILKIFESLVMLTPSVQKGRQFRFTACMYTDIISKPERLAKLFPPSFSAQPFYIRIISFPLLTSIFPSTNSRYDDELSFSEYRLRAIGGLSFLSVESYHDLVSSTSSSQTYSEYGPGRLAFVNAT